MVKKIILLLGLVIMSLSSCVTKRQINYLQDSSEIPVYASSVEFKDYLLQKGDYLYIRLLSLNEDDMKKFNGNVRQSNLLNSSSSDNATMRLYMYVVEEDGCVHFPYVPSVKAEGKTVQEVQDQLSEAMKPMMLNYSVDVRLMNKTFSVVSRGGSGRYSLSKEKLNIFEALAMYGGMQTYSKVDKVQLIRETDHGTIIKTFDLRAKTIIDSEYFYIQPNDVLYIPYRNSYIFGVSNYMSLVSIVMSTISFGVFIYSIPNLF